MGKVKKIRQKYHLSLKKSKSLSNLSESTVKNEAHVKSNSFMASTENIFSGIDISWDDINKQLPKDFDVRSVVSTKSRKELKEEERHLKKKEKKKLRHDRFIQKLDVTNQLLKASKRKKRKKSTGDMSSLLDALPLLQSPSSSTNRQYEKPKAKPKGILKAKNRLKQQSLDTKIFKRILEDKTFKENPLQAISQYLKQKVATDA